MSSSQLPKVLLGINFYSGKKGERTKLLQEFLNSIPENTQNYPNYDIVIFDDVSPCLPIPTHPDLPIKIIVADEPGVRWHHVRNRMHQYFLDHPEYDYLFAYDEDYKVLVPNWMNHIVACMENIPEIGILGAHWCRLADGVTRQLQHTPTGIISGGGHEVFTNKYVVGGCWALRREAVFRYNDDGTVTYDMGHPGADTWYGWEMTKRTGLKLCCTTHDLVFHTGQEFMKGQFSGKWSSPEVQAGKRLY